MMAKKTEVKIPLKNQLVIEKKLKEFTKWLQAKDYDFTIDRDTQSIIVVIYK